MKVTRKDYYRIVLPDGKVLTKKDGSVRQCETDIECMEYIVNSGLKGKFEIYTPPYEVVVE